MKLINYNDLARSEFKLADSHIHIDILAEKEALTPTEIAKEASENNVNWMLLPSVSLANQEEIYDIVTNQRQVVGAYGTHPMGIESLSSNFEISEYLEDLERLLKRPKIVAVGEIGLDYSRNPHQKGLQEELFRQQLRLATKCNKPVLVHSRMAGDDLIRIIKEEGNATELKGVLHCFNGSFKDACDLLDLGFYLSFSGMITFKRSADLRETLKKIPLSSILLETDAPYLTPEVRPDDLNHGPCSSTAYYRRLTPQIELNCSNSPKFLPIIACVVAKCQQVSLQSVARKTTANFKKLFLDAAEQVSQSL